MANVVQIQLIAHNGAVVENMQVEMSKVAEATVLEYQQRFYVYKSQTSPCERVVQFREINPPVKI